jgi:alkylhydroperoxidase/carboxymuconolactone decarboxylase family protein YurZ
MSEEPMGMLYFSNDLYGDDMTRLQEALREAGFELNIDPLEDQADLMKLTDADHDEAADGLELPGASTGQVTAVLAGLASIQMQALAVGDIEKVEHAGESMGKLAEENPDLVREAFLENNHAFRVAAMPDEMLDHLDLKLEDGQLYENTDGDEWTEVEIGE